MVRLIGYRTEIVTQSAASVTPIQADEYHRRHPDFEFLLKTPDSFFHVLFPEYVENRVGEVNESSNIFTGAKYLEKLRQAGAYRLIDQPAMFVYRTTYNGKKTLGILGAVHYKDYRERRIVPHEGYISSKKKKIESKSSKLEYFTGFPLVCGTLPSEILKIYLQIDDMQPILTCKQKEVFHEVFQLSEAQTNRLTKQFEQVSHLYIADGHHRFEAYSDVIDNLQKSSKLIENFEYIPVAVFNATDIDVLRFYRLVRNVSAPSMASVFHFFHKCSKLFEITDILPTSLESSLHQMIDSPLDSPSFSPVSAEQKLKIGPELPCLADVSLALEPAKPLWFSVYVSAVRKWFSFRAKSGYTGLNLTFLHENFLADLLDSRGEGSIEYYPETQGNFLYMMKLAESTFQNNIVIHSHKIEVRDVIQAAEHKKKMPPKSSLFYPKPLVGLMIRPLLAPKMSKDK